MLLWSKKHSRSAQHFVEANLAHAAIFERQDLLANRTAEVSLVRPQIVQLHVVELVGEVACGVIPIMAEVGGGLGRALRRRSEAIRAQDNKGSWGCPPCDLAIATSESNDSSRSSPWRNALVRAPTSEARIPEGPV